MRRYIKKQVNGIIDSIVKALNVSKKKTKLGDINQVLTLLPEIQNAIIEAGNSVEKALSEGCAEVKPLEDACELLFEISVALENKNISAANSGYGNCISKINEFREMIASLPEEYEAVFCPYNASMWDALESVWMERAQDPNCTAYVIPIPYYDKNPDGSFKEVHYEGDRFPSNVPITHYNDYNFEAEHPEEIYIHNPYDEFNYVTSVHPFFYTKNLKKYTDELVYIPYFVLEEVDPESEWGMEYVEKYVTTPGVVNSDKVVLQSENMRKIYLKILEEWLGKDVCKEQRYEERIVGTGSPKIDKLKRATLENIDIPEEWKQLIYREDGSRRKVIFYNTSIGALLRNVDAMLDKIEDTLLFFEKQKENVILLWRPHPLLLSTMESMRPELTQRYNEIVKKYRDEAWGIYDDSSDLDRALVVSDAYYGDQSSVLRIYKTIGKPIMIQNVDITYELNSDK